VCIAAVVVLGVGAGGVSDVSDDVMKLHFDAKYIENKAMVYSKEVIYDVIRMSWGVLQICDLENDGTNCSTVIKVASVHVVHTDISTPCPNCITEMLN